MVLEGVPEAAGLLQIGVPATVPGTVVELVLVAAGQIAVMVGLGVAAVEVGVEDSALLVVVEGPAVVGGVKLPVALAAGAKPAVPVIVGKVLWMGPAEKLCVVVGAGGPAGMPLLTASVDHVLAVLHLAPWQAPPCTWQSQAVQSCWGLQISP